MSVGLLFRLPTLATVGMIHQVSPPLRSATAPQTIRSLSRPSSKFRGVCSFLIRYHLDGRTPVLGTDYTINCKSGAGRHPREGGRAP